MKKERASWVQLTPDVKWVLLLTGAAIALWTVGLGNMPLRDWDEGYYSVVVREIVRTGEWFYPMRFGEPYFPKPPFGYWVGLIGYAIFGHISEFTLRFPMALLTAFGVPFLYGVVRELSPRRSEAIIAAGVYMTLLPAVRNGRLHMFDGFINTLLILLIFCLLRSKKSLPWAFGIGLCLAGIALSKGILAIALGGIAFAFVVVDRRWHVLKNPYLWLGIGVGATVTFGWNIAQWQRYGDVFLQEHLGFNNVARIATTLEGHDEPVWFYLVEIAKYTFPWVLFWPGGLLLAWRARHTSRGLLVLTGTVLFMSMVSLMQTKLPWYVMPVYPFMAMAVGWQVAQPVKAYAYYLRWIFALAVLAGVGGIVYFAIEDPQIPLLLLGACLSATMGLVARQLFQRQSYYANTLLVGMYSCLFLLMLSRSWIWEINESFPVVGVGAMVRTYVPAGEPFYSSYPYNRPSLEFYSEHRMLTAKTDELEQKREEGFYLLLEPEALMALEIPPAAVVETAEGLSLIMP